MGCIWFFFGICFASDKISPSSSQALTNPTQASVTVENDDSLDFDLEKKDTDINWLSMISSLLTVILLILVAAWVYKKFIGVSAEKLLSGKIKEAKENAISVLTTTPIGQNKYLHLVEVKNQKFLIGSTSNDIIMLKEIETTQKEQRG